MSELEEFCKSTKYLTEQRILSSTNIFEYDIRQANINMLYSYDKISPEEYLQLQNVPKIVREIIIGKKEQKDNFNGNKDTYNTIASGIAAAKYQFMLKNKIDIGNVVRVANDAVYIISNFPVQFTTFDLNNNGRIVEFACKGNYSSFIQFANNVCVFFNIDSNDNFIVDVKGISDKNLPLHNSFISFICNILFYRERTDQATTIKVFNEFYSQYVNRQLPIDYYREFNSSSSYRILSKDTVIKQVGPMFVDQKYISNIDISYNINILREIYADICGNK